MRVFFIICSIVIIASGLLMLIVNPVTGIIFIALGIFFLWYSKRYKKKPKKAEPAEEPVSTKEETIRVAGISNYTDAVLALGHDNDEYEYSKKQIIENGMEDEEIYQYFFRTFPAKFVYEPENPHDSNAIAIYVANEKIGYVKRGETAHVRELIESGKLDSAYCDIDGGPFKRYDSESETMETKDLNFGASVTMRIKDEDT